jgi:hypothetical protein
LSVSGGGRSSRKKKPPALIPERIRSGGCAERKGPSRFSGKGSGSSKAGKNAIVLALKSEQERIDFNLKWL